MNDEIHHEMWLIKYTTKKYTIHHEIPPAKHLTKQINRPFSWVFSTVFCSSPFSSPFCFMFENGSSSHHLLFCTVFCSSPPYLASGFALLKINFLFLAFFFFVALRSCFFARAHSSFHLCFFNTESGTNTPPLTSSLIS